MNSSHYSLPPTAVSDRKAKTPEHPYGNYRPAPSDLLNASIGALTQDESLNPVAVGCDCRNGCRYFK